MARARRSVTSAIVANEDFLAVDVTGKKYRKVEYALVDPPCSGSGMLKRSRASGGADTYDEARLLKLANLQVPHAQGARRG